MEYDVSKLPKWAQDKIKNLERNCEDLDAKLSAMGGDTETSRIVWMDGMTRRSIKNYGTIRFRIGETIDDFECIDVNLHNRTFTVYGSRAIRILPHAANAVEIAIDDTRLLR